ncbi:hypothetical protein ONR75_24155 [Rhodopseudomonas sp. P2A-2r]|uniref:hypothetical protein n=1 Tax=Rhodopseudomonas sp. P2A-2r TaxID=2991972 RepID=UPI0022344172|nr:hypothetical protein [Rhodopseudomonas sp. P2A-2r]UZE47933.1 hypothetical protein ONR75_24155 [Rhodopseudomonas sp. P2A-2r]
MTDETRQSPTKAVSHAHAWTCEDTNKVNGHCRNPHGCHCREITALCMARDTFKSWVIITDPGCVPSRKGPFDTRHLKRFLKEAMIGRPYSHLMVVGCAGDLWVDDGTNCLEMMDARSASTARKHRERLKSIRLPVPLSSSQRPEGER